MNKSNEIFNHQINVKRCRLRVYFVMMYFTLMKTIICLLFDGGIKDYLQRCKVEKLKSFQVKVFTKFDKFQGC